VTLLLPARLQWLLVLLLKASPADLNTVVDTKGGLYSKTEALFTF